MVSFRIDRQCNVHCTTLFVLIIAMDNLIQFVGIIGDSRKWRTLKKRLYRWNWIVQECKNTNTSLLLVAYKWHTLEGISCKFSRLRRDALLGTLSRWKVGSWTVPRAVFGVLRSAKHCQLNSYRCLKELCPCNNARSVHECKLGSALLLL